MFKIGSLWH